MIHIVQICMASSRISYSADGFAVMNIAPSGALMIMRLSVAVAGFYDKVLVRHRDACGREVQKNREK